MQLTKHTDYAFRVLIYLAMQPTDTLATIQEISEYFDISRNHMMKIVQKLANAAVLSNPFVEKRVASSWAKPLKRLIYARLLSLWKQH